MNDEVSVTELMEREGWQENPAPASSRFRVVAVMLAVVLGCGLAALLVHIGASQERADSPSPAIFDAPHGPTGGLAGGGVPASQDETEVTGTSTSITVTNEAPPEGTNGLPWATHHRKPSTVTVTQSATQPSTTDSATPGPHPTSGNPGNGAGNGGGNGRPSPTGTPSSTAPATTKPPGLCVLGLIFC